MQLAAIYRYPVKSLRGHALDEAEVETIGLSGDRRWLVVDPAGMALTSRDILKMAEVEAEVTTTGLRLAHRDHGGFDVALPGAEAEAVPVTVWDDRVVARQATRAVADYLSRVLGREVRLVYLDDVLARPADVAFAGEGQFVSFADAFPVLLASATSAEDLCRRAGRTIPVLAFRPNVVIDGAEPWAEDTWQRVKIGAVTFRVVKPCDRCIVTTRDPDTGVPFGDNEPLRTLGKFHRASDGRIMFGQNMVPEGMGTIRVGDRVEVLEFGPSNVI